MKKYAAYKPSGVEWLGEVPDHWEVKRLKFSLSLSTGGAWGSDFADDGIIVLRSTEQAVDGKWKIEDPARRILTADEFEAARLVAGDLVITKSSGSELHIGKTSLVDEEVAAMNCCYSNFMQRIRLKADHEPRFFFYLLNSGLAREQFSYQSNTATGLANLSKSIIADLFTAAPPLPEQRAIAAFLDERTAHLDGLIRRKDDLLKLLAEQRAALITRAVTRGLDSDVPLQDSGVQWLGQVPAHWTVTRLKFVADVHSGIAKGKKYLPNQELVEVPYLRVANVQDGYLNLDDITTISVTPAEAKSYELQPLDILMNEGGDNDKLGRGTVWEGQVEPCIHQNHVFAIRHNGKVDSWFLSYFFGSTACKPYFFLSGNQATNLASISASAISDTPLGLPPLAEQREIVVAINKGNKRLDKMTDITTREIEKLREYRAALITAAVTGRIDVRATVAVPELAEA